MSNLMHDFSDLFNRAANLLRLDIKSVIDNAYRQRKPQLIQDWINNANDIRLELRDARGVLAGSRNTMDRKAKEHEAGAVQEHESALKDRQENDNDGAKGHLAIETMKRSLSATASKQSKELQGQLDDLNAYDGRLETAIEIMTAKKEYVVSLLSMLDSKNVAVRAYDSVNRLKEVGDVDIDGLVDSVLGDLDQVDGQIEVRSGTNRGGLNDLLSANGADSVSDDALAALDEEIATRSSKPKSKKK